ncbi:unnamed protein product [Gongylonema pulchrum]|uniref:DUF1336 domain-containing protein n=1 Tax=Gongylonema pulchrum TaxID=637853 RepID=A0A183DUF3_9BILA|nr:unnamed protein product [Gongylonema pulchrum]
MDNQMTSAPSDMSDELKSAITAEIRVQIVPVVKELVREVVSEFRTVIADMVKPLHEDMHRFHGHSMTPNALLPENAGIYVSGSPSVNDTQGGQENTGENCEHLAISPASMNRSKAEPREPRAQSSTSDCPAFSFIYYNTACLIPIPTLLHPGRFAAHMKSRKYFVKDGKITGRIRQFGQVCHLLQDYDHILHRQYYCHGNTIGPATIRKNIWYLTSKVNLSEVVGCSLVSYEIGDNVTVKVSKVRYKSEMPVKEEIPAEEMDVSVVLNPNAELQRFVDSMEPLQALP